MLRLGSLCTGYGGLDLAADDQLHTWLAQLPANTVYVDTGEPSATERDLGVRRMSDAERREFGEGIERVCDRLRAMTPEDAERFLADLACATSNDVARTTESDVPPVGGWGLWPTFRHTESIKETSEMTSSLPEKTYLAIARSVDPVDAEETAANRSFRAAVDAASAAGRSEAAADIRAFADVRENSARQHPPASREAFLRNDAVVAAYRKAALIALHGSQS